MTKKMPESDWENLRMQLKVLVDVYCDLQNDMVKMKELMKKLVKYIACQKKPCKKK